MHSRVALVLSLVLLVCLFAHTASAERTVTVKRVTPQEFLRTTPGKVSLPPVSCVAGNTNAQVYAISNWFIPPEDYYLVFDPTIGCGVCPTGFQVTQIRFLVQVATGDSCEMDLQASFAEAEETTPGCTTVTQEHCVAAQYTAVLPSAGLYEIGLPLDCVCADKAYPYAIGIHLSAIRCRLGGVPDIITDDHLTNCTSWDFYDGTDLDLVADAGFPGNIIFRADADCCEPFVGVDGKSWGMIKSLFHD